jgi:histidyl-tRNA synthetase
MNIKRLKGTQDILPQDAELWQDIEEKSRKLFSLYGYNEIRTPIIEESALFSRSVGTDSDIVKKQFYSFKDQGGRDICLRPEETASVCRAYLENQIDKTEGFVKLFYMGPMFRSERPQAGRFRQFHQIGVEAIGSYSVYLDAEVLIILDKILKISGIGDYMFHVNSLGCEKDKSAIKAKLKKGLKDSLKGMCEDCIRRYDTNILRILDCKSAPCKKIVSSVSLDNTLCDECNGKFTQLKLLIDKAGIRYTTDSKLVRGLDYYTGIVFEVKAKSEAAQDAIAAGGRYDNLISDLGGKPQGATGFAIGIERVVQLIKDSLPLDKKNRLPLVFIIALGDSAHDKGFEILSNLRNAGVCSYIDYQQKSFKAQMRYADKIGARFVVIIGDDELKKGVCVLKDMKDGTQKELVLDNVIESLVVASEAKPACRQAGNHKIK